MWTAGIVPNPVSIPHPRADARLRPALPPFTSSEEVRILNVPLRELAPVQLDPQQRFRNDWSETEKQIIEAARHVIADEGYHNFSLRGTAAKSGMHLKSLQYYFKTKRDLLNAVVDYTLEQYYFATYDKLFARKKARTPRQRFLVVIEYLLDDLADPFTARLFPELWALANHDEDVRTALDLFYQRHLASLEEMIHALNPKLGALAAKRRAALVGMMIEGLVLILGHGKPRHPHLVDLEGIARQTILDIVKLPARAPTPSVRRNVSRKRSALPVLEGQEAPIAPGPKPRPRRTVADSSPG